MREQIEDNELWSLVKDILNNELRHFVDAGVITPVGENVQMTQEEITIVRTMPDFDLIMLVSEINDLGWEKARLLLPMIAETINNKTHN